MRTLLHVALRLFRLLLYSLFTFTTTAAWLRIKKSHPADPPIFLQLLALYFERSAAAYFFRTPLLFFRLPAPTTTPILPQLLSLYVERPTADDTSLDQLASPGPFALAVNMTTLSVDYGHYCMSSWYIVGNKHALRRQDQICRCVAPVLPQTYGRKHYYISLTSN